MIPVQRVGSHTAQNSCWENCSTLELSLTSLFLDHHCVNIKVGSLPWGRLVVALGPWPPPGSMLFILRASAGWLKRKKADWPKHSMHPARGEDHVGINTTIKWDLFLSCFNTEHFSSVFFKWHRGNKEPISFSVVVYLSSVNYNF